MQKNHKKRLPLTDTKAVVCSSIACQCIRGLVAGKERGRVWKKVERVGKKVESGKERGRVWKKVEREWERKGERVEESGERVGKKGGECGRKWREWERKGERV